MLNALAILLLALNILSVQAYAQAYKEQQTSKSDKPSPPAAPVAPQHTSSPALQIEHQDHVQADVRVISTPPKDRYDIAAFWVNIALAGIGFLGIGVGIGTLIFLRSQVVEMRRQANQMEAQLKEMQKASEIENKTLILQYRPRIVVRFASASEFNLADLGKPATAKVRLTIVNTGGSPAHIAKGEVALWWAEVPRPHPNKVTIHKGTEGQIGEATLQPGQQAVWEETLDMDAVNDTQWANYHEGLPTEDHRSLFVVGTVYYTDNLDIPRRTGINRSYDPQTMNFKAADSEREYND